MAKTKIEWASDVWNPIRGCSRVSEGCRHCYAETMAALYSSPGQWGNGLAVIQNKQAHWTGKVEFIKDKLLDPLRWKKPRRIFVNSVSDLFHEKVEYEWIDQIFSIMALCPQHQFLILTKRPERMLKYMTELRSEGPSSGYIGLAYGRPARFFPQAWKLLPLNKEGLMPWPLPNVWLGVSVENQKAAEERLPILAKVPCRIRFASCEPLLGPLDITRWISKDAIRETGGSWTNELLDWVIVGGESGRSARPMLSLWADSLRQQCETAGTAFFFKQNGEWVDAGNAEFGQLPSGPCKYLRSDGTEWPDSVPLDEDADVNTVKRVGKKRSGETLYGKVYHAYPDRS